jgi:hypothetical protein
MSSKCYRKRSQKGGAAKEVTGFNTIPYAAATGGSNSQAAMMAKIPQSITEQGMNFQAKTSTYHRSRKARKQRGGAAPVETIGDVLPASMTGPMTTVASGILGGSATGRLDTMLSQTASMVKQVGVAAASASRSKSSKGSSRLVSRSSRESNSKRAASSRGSRSRSSAVAATSLSVSARLRPLPAITHS